MKKLLLLILLNLLCLGLIAQSHQVRINLNTLEAETDVPGFIKPAGLSGFEKANIDLFLTNYTGGAISIAFKDEQSRTVSLDANSLNQPGLRSNETVSLKWTKDNRLKDLGELAYPFSLELTYKGKQKKFDFPKFNDSAPGPADVKKEESIQNIMPTIPYYDALSLKRAIEKKDQAETVAILLRYMNDGQDIGEAIKKFQDNPFFKERLEFLKGVDPDQLRQKLKDEGHIQALDIGAAGLKDGLASAVNSIGGLNVTTFADEFSQFLIDRTKQELNIAFFNRLKKFFSKTPEVGVLFPKTTDALENLLTYEYPTMIKTLRNAFYDDLKDVFFRSDDVFKLPKYKPLIREFPEIILSLKTIQVIAEIDNERHPSDILADFKNVPEWQEYRDFLSVALHNFHTALQLGHQFSESVRFTTYKDPFELKKLENGEVLIQLDTGIARATSRKETIYKIDTTEAESLDDLIAKVELQIRSNIDPEQFQRDPDYADNYLKNLLGAGYNKAQIDPTKIFSKEQLVFEVDAYLVQNKRSLRRTRTGGGYHYELNTQTYSGSIRMRNSVREQIRKDVDAAKIESDPNYLYSFLDNLLGTPWKSEIRTINANSIEEVVAAVDQLIRANTTKFDVDIPEILSFERKYESSRAWITRQHINYLIQDTTAFNIYTGLIYQQSLNSAIKIRKSISSVISSDLTLTKDTILLAGSSIRNGSTIKSESIINGEEYLADKVLPDNLFVTGTSTVKNSSIIKSGSSLLIAEHKNFHDLLAANKDDIFLIRDYLVELIELAEQVDRVFNEIKEKKKNDEKPSKEELYNYINLGIDVIEYATDISALLDERIQVDAYLKIARTGNDMYQNIYQEQYTAAVSNLVSILNVISEEVNKRKSVVQKISSDQSSGISNQISVLKAERDKLGNGPLLSSDNRQYRSTYNAEIKKLKQEKKSGLTKFKQFKEVTAKIYKYGTFMANIVQSDSAEEVRAAIEAAALPVGSYTMKREARWNIALNAYVGAYYGKEELTELSNDTNGRTIGAWAPLGFSFSHGLGRKTWGSLSVFLTALDFGPIVSFRLENPDPQTSTVMDDPNTTEVEASESTTFKVDELPEITLENIIAPGAYVVYGIPKLPLSLGAGVQRGPRLREIRILNETMDAAGNVVSSVESVVQSSAYRWQVFLAVDIPIVNFFSRSK